MEIYEFRIVMTINIPHGINWPTFLKDKHSVLCEVVATFLSRFDERPSLVNVKDWRVDGCLKKKQKRLKEQERNRTVALSYFHATAVTDTLQFT
jgi:hypothetical protein